MPKVCGNVSRTFIKRAEIDVTGVPYAAKLPFQILPAHPNVEFLYLGQIALQHPTEWIGNEVEGFNGSTFAKPCNRQLDSKRPLELQKA
ncbi:hypothetical protein B9Z55_022633 [Caenorhabditis nigoni]|nr:hypothetical protein B9Z55_022633 [Caenorhabditis nigoni]